MSDERPMRHGWVATGEGTLIESHHAGTGMIVDMSMGEWCAYLDGAQHPIGPFDSEPEAQEAVENHATREALLTLKSLGVDVPALMRQCFVSGFIDRGVTPCSEKYAETMAGFSFNLSKEFVTAFTLGKTMEPDQ